MTSTTYKESYDLHEEHGMLDEFEARMDEELKEMFEGEWKKYEMVDVITL